MYLWQSTKYQKIGKKIKHISHLLTAGDFDLSLVEVGVPARLLLLLVTLSVAELVIVICWFGRLSPSRGEQGADADWGCTDGDF